MCGSRRGPLHPDGGPAAPDGHDDPQDLGRTGLLLGVASTLRLLFGLLVGVLLIGSRGLRVVRRIVEEAVAAASTTTIGAKGFCLVAAANPTERDGCEHGSDPDDDRKPRAPDPCGERDEQNGCRVHAPTPHGGLKSAG